MEEDQNLSPSQMQLQNEVTVINEKQINLENKLEQILGIVTNLGGNQSA